MSIREEKAWNMGFKAGREDALYSVFDLKEEASKYGLSYPLCPYCGQALYLKTLL